MHRFVGVRGKAGKGRAVRHFVADLPLGKRSFDPAARVQDIVQFDFIGVGARATRSVVGTSAVLLLLNSPMVSSKLQRLLFLVTTLRTVSKGLND
jgi:hypothetical protein